MPRSLPLILGMFIVIGTVAASGYGQDRDLAAYFGFRDLEVIKIGQGAGPVSSADLNGDGLGDLIVVNNRASRIELHYQKANARPGDGPAMPPRANEFPEHWRFRRETLSVSHLVGGVTAHDFDGDGLTDLIYAGLPPELVFMRQASPGVFEIARGRRVRGLAANRDGLAVADLLGDARPELLALVDGDIHVYPLLGDNLGEPVVLSGGDNFAALLLEDFDGDSRTDVIGIIPDNAAPVRIWFGGADEGLGVLDAQVRFEMPPLHDAVAVRLPGVPAARLAVIEITSKRIAVHEIAREQIEQTGDRDASLRVYGFTDEGNRKRDHAVVDVDGDGLLDLAATDTEANAVVVYRQLPGKGLRAGERFPSLSELTYIAGGDVDDDPYAELFVLSEKEGVVGRCDAAAGDLPFPTPLGFSAGHTPTALNLVELERGPCVAVIAKDGRDYVLDLIDMDGEVQTTSLGKLSRSPETIVALDADQNGRTDLLLFTQDKPMTMLYAGADGFTFTESKDMGQYGLVKDAAAENIAIFDIDGDGKEELLIAEKNYVRAVRYDPQPAAGVSPGWQVVEQINARDRDSELVSLAVLGDRVIAADRANDRLIFMARDNGRWRESESLVVRGFEFNSIHAGRFSGDEEENILAVGDDGFAVIRLAGERIALKEAASWRTAVERRTQHELAFGDVNDDGFADMVALDAGEQMCEIFTFAESGRMLYAAGFQVFESNLFFGGDAREFQPSQALIVDVTGDGADDLILLAHDRVLIYPQMTESDG